MYDCFFFNVRDSEGNKKYKRGFKKLVKPDRVGF